ncbi:MFS transporter [Cellulosimicrobium sp. CUA-896]|uniref:MFS transporter n=1 Tax=Cellulosimicrobium sp. CUA-896 TaxID=1517881 RepID=UPI000965DD0C|nr:MFS transporter [Cellulosimicrobium sp. CUA-896]OLT46156.1 hypothetical protein BJF88_04950 [Cellulosimicrobium sp. CUA-896]
MPESVDGATRPVTSLVLGCVGILTAYLPVVGVPVILGEIGTATGASTAELQWVTASGLLALAAAVLPSGVLGHRLGRHVVLVAGLALVLLGAVVGVVAGLVPAEVALGWLYTGQVVIGLGGGALLTSTLAVVSDAATTHHRRGLYIPLWASSLVVGSGLGPFVSGAVATFTTWGWTFLPLAVVAAGALALAVAVAPPARTPRTMRQGIDLPGQLTSAAAVTALVYTIIQAPTTGWASTPTVVSGGASVLLVAAFVAVEARAVSPIVPLRLFRSPGFVVAALAATSILFAIVGIAFVLTLYLSGHQHLSVLGVADRIGFLYLFAALTGPVVGYAHRYVAMSTVLVTGLAISALGVGLLAAVPAEAGLVALAWRLSLTGIGVGAVLSVVSSVAIHSVQSGDAGMAGATNTLFRQVGAALGPAVAGTIWTTRTTGGGPAVEGLHVSMLAIAWALGVSAVLALLTFATSSRRARLAGR